MGSSLLLWFGALSVAAAFITLLLAVSMGASAPTGVALSLTMIERPVATQEVGRSELAAIDR